MSDATSAKTQDEQVSPNGSPNGASPASNVGVAKKPTDATGDSKTKKAADTEIVPMYGPVYYFMRWSFAQVFRIGGWKIIGQDNVPKTGAVILAPNHASLFDPPIVGCSSPRRVTTMGKAELFDQKWLGLKILGWIITRMATFPVKRGAPDRRAIRRAEQILKDGEVLVIFPEGTRTRTGELGDGEIGIAMIAHKNKAPIVPMYLGGTGKALSPRHRGFRFIKTEVRFGKPLYFEEEYARKGDRETLEAITARVMQEIAKLRGEATIK
jgi:1-acyl-sn-glycerol-3-phosphate acyltransferase